MKKNHGITIIELVIVMIIMIILVSLAVYSGIDSVEKAKATELYEEMNSMKNALGGIVTQKLMGEYDDEWLKGYYHDEIGEGWYKVYSTSSLKSDALKDMYEDLSEKYGLDVIKRNYLVNFEEQDVILETPVEVLGSSVKSYESVRALVESDKI